jgi:ABC-type sugar transport system substrate-binding protein
MRRSIFATMLAAAATLALAGAAAAQPISEPASCSGYLASYANPNNGWIIQNLVMPAADELGVTVGEFTTTSAFAHEGSLEACIPDL